MADNQLVMAIDIGTTSVKCIVMNKKGCIVNSSSHGYQIINRKTSWVEQDPEDWWEAVVNSIKDCLKQVESENILAISFSGHMSALVMVDKYGIPLFPSMLITDTRSAKQTSYLRTHYLKKFKDDTGNEPLDAFTVSKLLWVKEESPELMERAKKFFFPKDFVRFKITGKFGTDPTDAGNSLLYDSKDKKWNWNLINELDLPERIFPDIINTTDVFGGVTKETATLTGLKEGTPVITGGADMACSQIGTGATLDDTMAITLSTSGQVVMSISELHASEIGKVTFHPGVNGNLMYTMGTIFTGGLGVEWGYKLLFNKQEMNSSDYEELAILTEKMQDYSPGSQGLLFLPFLVGSGTPYFDAKDRASWIGLSLNQDKALLLRSLLEGITFNILENVNVIRDMGVTINKIYLGAGGSQNSVWCQIIADVLGMNVTTLANRDGSSLGAAIIAGTGIGMFNSIENAVKLIVKEDQEVHYNEENFFQYQKLFKGYKEVYNSINKYMNLYQ